MKKIKEYIKLIRVKHYFKNILIFLPLIFSGNLFDGVKILNCVVGFIAFSLATSFVYVINDIRDIENDRQHPVKKNRPLAAGTVSVKEGILLAIILLVISYILNIFLINSGEVNLNKTVLIFGLTTLYTVLNIAYSFGLKNKPIIDVFILVSGFLIRVLYGAAITSITVSNWLYLTVIAGAFYMGLGKRRNEIMKQGDKSREVLKRYSKEFLDKNMYVCLTLAIVFYSLWCVDVTTIERMGNNFMVWTVILVMIILMKYSLDIEGDSYGDPVDVLFKDKILMLMVALYGVIVFAMIYLL